MIKDRFVVPFFFEMFDGVFGLHSMLFHEPRLMFTHSASNFIDGEVDAFIHVLGLGSGFDYNVIRAKKKNFRDMAVLLNIKNSLGFNNFGVVEGKTVDFGSRILAESIGRFFVTDGYGYWCICICSFHVSEDGESSVSQCFKRKLGNFLSIQHCNALRIRLPENS